MVGNLIELLWPKKACYGLQLIDLYVEKQRGTVSSNSRVQTILFQWYSANLSTMAYTYIAYTYTSTSLHIHMHTHVRIPIHIHVYT